MLPAIITDHAREIDALCRAHHVRRLELFGSAATGEWDAERSDLDFLVAFRPECAWHERRMLEAAFEKLFARDVDLLRDREFKNPYFRQSVERSRTHLWGQARPSIEKHGVRVKSSPALKYLWDIRREVEYLHNTIDGLNLDTVQSNITLLRSLQMHLMIIGEALNQLSSRDPALYGRISDASGYVGQRNVLIHQYGDLDWKEIWRSVQQEIPLLAEEVDALIAELDPND